MLCLEDIQNWQRIQGDIQEVNQYNLEGKSKLLDCSLLDTENLDRMGWVDKDLRIVGPQLMKNDLLQWEMWDVENAKYVLLVYFDDELLIMKECLNDFLRSSCLKLQYLNGSPI